MPLKLVFWIIINGLIMVFIGLNLGNAVDISLGFVTFEGVPVFLGLFVAFLFGVLIAIPFAVRSASRKMQQSSDRRALRLADKRKRKEAKAALSNKDEDRSPSTDSGEVQSDR